MLSRLCFLVCYHNRAKDGQFLCVRSYTKQLLHKGDVWQSQASITKLGKTEFNRLVDSGDIVVIEVLKGTDH